MALTDLFKGKSLYTQEMLRSMVNKPSREQNKMLVDLQLRTQMLTKKDIGAWRMLFIA